MNEPSPFTAMQAAIDIVRSSPHPTNKIAATMFWPDDEAKEPISRTNHWPEAIDHTIGRDEKIGNSSGTVHAEVACIIAAGLMRQIPVKGASLCLTDPFCPNCAKNLAESGVEAIYIDHKGFDKDFAKRRGDHFDNMSMRIAEKAGVNVYEINRKEQRIVPICIAERGYRPANENPIEIRDIPADELAEHVYRGLHYNPPAEKFGAALCHSADGRRHLIISPLHVAVGFEQHYDADEIAHPKGKYSFYQEPVNRLLMVCARYGYKIEDQMIYSHEAPTSREQVNLIAAGIKSLMIGMTTRARDKAALKALRQLKEANALSVKPIK